VLLYRVKLRAKWLLFPGVDLHTRSRYRFLPRFFRRGNVETLDAGCGNGALAFAAYRLGNVVLGVTNSPEDVAKSRALFSEVGVDGSRLQFEVCNLYELSRLGRKFDQIICSETLEHIIDDDRVVETFHEILNDGGVLHLCCPNAAHRLHNLGRTAEPEDGRHVRDGYTFESYRTLLARHNLQIVAVAGLGSPLLTSLDQVVRGTMRRLGVLGLPVLLPALVLARMDRLEHRNPFSLYVQAIKAPIETPGGDRTAQEGHATISSVEANVAPATTGRSA